jgi:predicted outer membrane repeat protein
MSTLVRTWSLTSAISFALAAGTLQAVTITVDSADDNPASTYCNLRDALQAIKDGSVTNVPTCIGAVDGAAFGTNDTVSFAEVLGGATITLSQGSLLLIGSSITINGSAQTIDAAKQSGVFETGTNLAFAFSHLYLTGGVSTASGGGVSVGAGSSAEFVDCTISGNTAKTNGGGIYAGPAATVTLVDSTVSGNLGDMGGAIFADFAAVSVTNSVIAYNEARYSGGAIYSAGNTLALNMATIKQNTAQELSGGVVSFFGTLDVSHSVITGNSGRVAGGVLASASNGTIAASTISGNTATCTYSCSGAIFLRDSTFSISGSTLSGNLAAGLTTNVSGGALLFNSTATFVNSTLTGNVGVGNAQVSGAAWEFQFTGDGLTFINSTISNNTAVAFYGKAAGGVLLGSVDFSPPPITNEKLTLSNTIVSANTPADSDLAWDPYGSTLSAAYSVLGSAQNVAEFNDPGDHNIFSDSPGLGPLMDNGGPTKTRALLPDSPALRTGSRALAAFAGQPLNYDQRGLSYLRDFSGSVDIGAFQDQGDRPFANGFEPVP